MWYRFLWWLKSLEKEGTPLDKAERVRSFFRGNPSTLVLLSGGVDSAVLALLASEGAPGRVRALTFRTPLVKDDEVRMAREAAEKLGIDLQVVDVDVLLAPGVLSNPADRCYFCRKTLHRAAKRYAEEAGFSLVADGLQADDLEEDRPGARAAAEDGVVHPLAEAGLTKRELRELARKAGLPNSERPAAPCLATRFPPGVPISRPWLEKIERGEAFLAGEGFENSRVRVFPPGLASLEIERNDLPRFFDRRERIVEVLKGIGFPVVSLDLEGLERGKMERFQEVGGMEEVWLVEASLDDATGEEMGRALEVLQEVSLEAHILQGLGKKGRPLFILRALASAENLDEVLDRFFRDTPTIGVRYWPVGRKKMTREIKEGDLVVDDLRLPVRIKISRFDDILRGKAEADDIARHLYGRPVKRDD